jgi:phenylpropionate dioxygenase-like ring-hydroxylating dioxygenase large terminal subunit
LPGSRNRGEIDLEDLMALRPQSAVRNLCARSHPELTRTFPLAPLHSGNAQDDDARATNEQDAALVACTQLGVASPVFVPGPYAPVEEDGVSQFVDWYARLLESRLDAPAPDP